MANTVFQSPKIKVRLKNDGGLAPTQPLTLKNAVGSGRRLDEMIDVTFSGTANSDIIVYDANVAAWINRTPTTITGNTFQIAVSNTTNNFDWNLSLPNNVIIANNLTVGQGFGVNGSITTANNLVVTGTADIAGVINRNPTIVVNLSGDVAGTGNTTLTDLANGVINITTVNQQNSIELGVDTTGAYVGNVFAGVGVHISNTGGENSNPTFSIGQPVETDSAVTFGNTTINGYANVSQTLQVSGRADLGNTGVDGTLRVTHTANLAGNVEIRGTAIVNGSLTVANTISVGNTNVTGSIVVSSTAEVHDTLTVNGAVYFANTLSVLSNTTIAGTLTTKNIVPDANNAYSLGTAEMRFTELWLSGNTLIVGNAVISDAGTTLSAETLTGDPISFLSIIHI